MTDQQKEKIVARAGELIGRPYKYGAKPDEAPNFFDCSSFIQYLFKQIGIELPRSTIEQAGEGLEIKNQEELSVGDLLFFRGRRGHYNEIFPQGIGHVVIYIGEGKIIHAGSRRIQDRPVVIEEGAIEEKSLQVVTDKLKPLVIIKRF